MDFEVQSGVPMLRRPGGRKPAAEFPLLQMEIGDSFLIPCDSNDPRIVRMWRSRLWHAVRQHRNLGFEGDWSTSKVEDGIRVWRSK